MTEEGRHDAARAELELADEEVRAAETLLTVGLPRVAMTRVYFAVFHALRARLHASGLEPRSHSGVQHLFNLHFVKPGTYPSSVSRLAARLQKYREEADYAETFPVDEEGARAELAEGKALIARLSAEIVSGRA